MNSLNGIEVLLSESMTEPGLPQARRRSWAERLRQPVRVYDLLRLPSLLRAVVTYIPAVPSRQVYQLANGKLLMHPAVWRELLAQLGRGEDRTHG